MEFTEEELKEVEEMAALFFSPESIAKVIGISDQDILNCLAIPEHQITIAFARGSLRTEVELRKSILKLAKQGSSPAQTLSMKLRDELNSNLVSLKLK